MNCKADRCTDTSINIDEKYCLIHLQMRADGKEFKDKPVADDHILICRICQLNPVSTTGQVNCDNCLIYDTSYNRQVDETSEPKHLVVPIPPLGPTGILNIVQSSHHNPILNIKRQCSSTYLKHGVSEDHIALPGTLHCHWCTIYNQHKQSAICHATHLGPSDLIKIPNEIRPTLERAEQLMTIYNMLARSPEAINYFISTGSTGMILPPEVAWFKKTVIKVNPIKLRRRIDKTKRLLYKCITFHSLYPDDGDCWEQLKRNMDRTISKYGCTQWYAVLVHTENEQPCIHLMIGISDDENKRNKYLDKYNVPNCIGRHRREVVVTSIKSQQEYDNIRARYFMGDPITRWGMEFEWTDRSDCLIDPPLS